MAGRKRLLVIIGLIPVILIGGAAAGILGVANLRFGSPRPVDLPCPAGFKVIPSATVFRNITAIDLGTSGAFVHRRQGFDLQDLTTGNFVTAKERVTRLRFWCSGTRSRRVSVRCRQPGPDTKTHSLIVSVNGKKIGDALLPADWGDLTFLIPGKQLRTGENIVTLETPKGTREPDIHFDLDSIRFGDDSRTAIQFPELRESSDGWWNLDPGESLVMNFLAAPGERIHVTGIPDGSGTVRIECVTEGHSPASQWLGAAGWFHKNQTVMTLEHPTGDRSGSGCTRLTVQNSSRWPSCPFRIRIARGTPGIPCLEDPPGEPPIRNRGKPNIVLITMDSLRVDALGAYGNPRGSTPVLDRIAGLGTQRLPSVAAAPYTTSSVASLLTGVEPQIHRVFRIGDPVPDNLNTLTAALSAAGYQTFGINAMPSINGAFGFRRGFDVYRDLFRESGNTASGASAPNRRTGATSPVNGDRVVRAVADRFKHLAPGTPYFIYIHIREPHLPYLPPESYLRMYHGEGWTHLMEESTLNALTTRKINPTSVEIDGLKSLYHSGLRYGDACLGDIIHTMQSSGRWDHTLVIVQSDHGEAFWEHRYFFHNDTVYEEMVAVPMIYTGGLEPGNRPDKILDAARTCRLSKEILAAAGLPPLNPDQTRHFDPPYRMQSHGIGVRGPIAFYQPPWKFIGQDLRPDVAQLFHLDADPGETVNCADSHPLITEWYQNFIDFRSRPERVNPAHINISESEIRQLQALGYLQE